MIRFITCILVAVWLVCAPCFAHANSIQSDVALWLSLRKPETATNFSSAAGFIQRRPDWPQMAFIRTKAEHALLDQNPSSSQILQWFGRNAPQSDRGMFAYWRALYQSGQQGKATQYAKQMWRAGQFHQEQQQTLIQTIGRSLTAQDHATRLDTLLWEGNLDRAADSLRYVSGDMRAAAQARIALQRVSSTAPSLVQNLSQRALQQAGVTFDRVRYARMKENNDLAARLLAQFRGDPGMDSPQWWRERNILARRALERREYQTAYRLAAAHGALAGIELAEAEWLAGWIATTRLQQPQKGFKHFEHMYHNVKSAISVSRAAYWAGVAAQQMGQKKTADGWYKIAARHMNTFYGQMAAYALGTPRESFAAFFKRNQTIGNSNAVPADLAAAATLLHQMGRGPERDLFLRAAITLLNEKKNAQAVIPLAQRLQSPEMALAAAKAAYDNGVVVTAALFPRITVPPVTGIERALTLGIIRQESMFDRYAISSANAMGLMQILPSTASHTARRAGIGHSNAAQLYQPDHNMRLGQSYLSGLLSKYNGFVPLAAAAYNAGPGNVDQWVAEMGDPRRDPRTWVDWVERIPFYETRNYVQRVWEAYSVYKVMP